MKRLQQIDAMLSVASRWGLKSLLLGFAALFCSSACAQHPLFYPVSEENGLPTDEIYEVAQDRFGLIWCASNSGLFSYDGIRVVRYVHSQEKSKAVTAVCVNAHDQVWCRNTAGQIFKKVADSLQLEVDPKPDLPLRGIAFDPSGGFCTVAGAKVMRYSDDGRPMDSLQLSQEIPLTANVLDAAMRDGKLHLLVSKIGTFAIDFQANAQQLTCKTDSLSTGGFNFKGNGLYWMVIHQQDQRKEILKWNAGKFERIYSSDPAEAPERWLRIVPETAERLWICTANGAYPLQFQNGKWERGP